MNNSQEGHLDRIQAHTAPYINEKIKRQSEASAAHFASQGRDAILRRLHELEHEYDVDRAAMVNFALIGGSVLAAGYFKKKSWLYMLATQLGFLFMHATYGWCPPVVVLRRMGFRTAKEIEYERRLLEKALQEDNMMESNLR